MAQIYTLGGQICTMAGGAAAGVPSFFPAPGFTYSGVFGNYQNFTLNYPAGGLGAKSPALPYALFQFGEDGTTTYNTDPTYSANTFTQTASTAAQVAYQTSILPGGNAQAALSWIPNYNASNSSACFGNGASTINVTGGYGSQLYIWRKTYCAFSAIADNIKTLRLWPAAGIGNHPDAYFSYNSGFGDYTTTIECVTGNPVFSGLNSFGGSSSSAIPYSTAVNQWFTDELFWQESTLNNTDGILQIARNAQMAYALAGRWSQNNTANGNNTPYQFVNLDEFTSGSITHVPNGTTDIMYYGLHYFDTNFLQSFTSNEGTSYYTTQLTHPINTGSDRFREIQIQTLRTDTEIDYYLRRGAQSIGSPYSLFVQTGYGTAIYAGYGIWQQ
jgi:hypothetical protein